MSYWTRSVHKGALKTTCKWTELSILFQIEPAFVELWTLWTTSDLSKLFVEGNDNFRLSQLLQRNSKSFALLSTECSRRQEKQKKLFGLCGELFRPWKRLPLLNFFVSPAEGSWLALDEANKRHQSSVIICPLRWRWLELVAASMEPHWLS